MRRRGRSTALRYPPSPLPAALHVPPPGGSIGGHMSLLAPSRTIGASDLSSAAATERPIQRSRFAGRRVHFVGIGGVGMSGLAHILLDAGADVSGTDPFPTDITRRLEDRGALVADEQDGSLLTADVDLVVRTAAVREENEEIAAAREYGIRTIYYAELLGQIMAERVGIAVAGTHGKSTTTAMLAYALTRCGLDPSFVVGGTVPQLGGGSHSGTGEVFVAEACEFNRSFLNLAPKVAVVTNIEADHLDTYPGGLAEIEEAFSRFCAGLSSDGRLIANGDDPHSARLIEEHKDRVWRVGKGLGCEWTLVPAGLKDGCPVAHLQHEGKLAATIRLSVPGQHNLYNAAQAVVAAVAVGADVKQAAEAVSDFRGVDRRQMPMGEVAGVGAPVVDDYAHHPTEIRLTLSALRERYAPDRLICIFQPHQASRTRHLLDDFATSFAGADLVFLPDIYSVRDTADDQRFVSSGTLAERIRAAGQHAEHVPTFEKTLERVRGELRAGDLVVTMGAGNVWQIGRRLVEGA